jgi:hypothetical protein
MFAFSRWIRGDLPELSMMRLNLSLSDNPATTLV